MEGQAFFTPRDFLEQFGAIARIAQHRVPGFGKVNADLIASSGFQSDLKS